MRIATPNAYGLRKKQIIVVYVKNKPYQARFIETKIDVCIDGRKEVWELERIDVRESKMFVTYKLKEVNKYETGG